PVTGKDQHLLLGPTGGVTSVAFSPDGTLIVTTSTDQTARLWDPRTGQLQMVLRPGPHPLYMSAFSPDGARVAIGVSSTVSVFELQGLQEKRHIPGHPSSVDGLAGDPVH